jgi:glycosyltransferase involved in cell wall biosynthesis
MALKVEPSPSTVAPPTVSFVTWYPSCRRSDTLATRLGGRSHLIHYLEFKRPAYAPVKYLLQAVTTFWRLLRDRPDVVFVASPPVFAVCTVWAYARLSGIPFIIDAHTGVFDDPRWTWLSRVSRFLSRAALATVVTNRTLAERVHAWGANAVIIGDVPVRFPDVPPADLGDGFHVVVVNTFSQDEPLSEVIRAAQLAPDVRFHITGNARHSRNVWNGTLPSNARFTGWLSDDAYAGLLKGADAIVSLTTHDHTMQRGGYEAMAVEKPLITSDWPLLRETFSQGTIHVDNSAHAIARAVTRARVERVPLTRAMRRLRRERGTVFNNLIVGVQQLIRKGIAS